MKIFHSLSLFGISIYLVVISRGYRILHEHHYWKLLTISVIFTIIYSLPVVFISIYIYHDANTRDSKGISVSEESGWSVAIFNFASWVYHMFKREEMGMWGFLLASVIHVQIYIFLFVMSCLAGQMRNLIERREKLKESISGTYDALELNHT